MITVNLYLTRNRPPRWKVIVTQHSRESSRRLKEVVFLNRVGADSYACRQAENYGLASYTDRTLQGPCPD